MHIYARIKTSIKYFHISVTKYLLYNWRNKEGLFIG